MQIPPLRYGMTTKLDQAQTREKSPH